MFQTKVLAISGSLRPNGNSEMLLDVFLQEFGRQVPDSCIEKIVLRDIALALVAITALAGNVFTMIRCRKYTRR